MAEEDSPQKTIQSLASMYSLKNISKARFGKARSVTPSQPTEITLAITLEHFDNPSVPKTFTTGDEIGGYVSMEMPEPTEFDAVSITLEGTATAFVRPPLLSPGGSNRDHKQSQTFLTLQEPVDRSELRRIRTKEIGWFYQIPFRFEVPPDMRKPTEWQAKMRESVRQAQLKLPPSYEKDSVPSTAPNVAVISYCIKAKLLKMNNADKPGEMTLMTLGKTSRMIRIVPIVKEEPPLQICSIPGKESTSAAIVYLEGKAWTGSQGQMKMEMAQPKSLCVPISTGYDTCQKEYVETRAKVNLRFEPTEVNGLPPKLTRITANLLAATRVSSNPMSDCPYQIGARADGTDDGLSVETTQMVGGTVQVIQWHRDLAGHNRDMSAYEKPGGRRYCTTAVPLRLVLPLNKQYLPTFHSSLISHFYVIVLILSFRMHGDAFSPKKESMRLEVPIQVSSELFVNKDSNFSDDSDEEEDSST